jgi:tetratricopeptide (TPR) repeat protein
MGDAGAGSAKAGVTRRCLAAFVLAAVVMSGLSSCVKPANEPAAASARSEAPRPWQDAGAVVSATEADVQKNGARAVASHIADLEKTLADAPQYYHDMPASDGRIYRLADGPTETLGVLLEGVASKQGVIAIRDPYPAASYLLGFYYNDVGRPQDALRVLDLGLALPTAGGRALGRHRPHLISERGSALALLKRWPEALDDYEKGTRIEGLEPRDHALMLRGKGLALTELGRLDDAEKAYRDSLVLEPDNALASRELTYIAALRTGGPKSPIATSVTKDALQPSKTVTSSH